MNPLRILAGRLIVVAAAALAACAPVTVTSFTEQGVDLTRYRSYGWDAVDPAVPGDPRLDSNPFFHDYVSGAIDRHLATRGYQPSVVQPDLRVHYHASTTQRVYISGTEPADVTCRDCTAQVYDQGSLLIDLVDARTGALVWRGAAQSDLAAAVGEQTRMELAIERVVERILAKLPRRL
jgi:hypothetical protein